MKLPPELFLGIMERYFEFWKSFTEYQGHNEALIRQKWVVKRAVVLRTISWHYKETFDQFLFRKVLSIDIQKAMKKSTRKDQEIEDIREQLLQNFDTF